VVPSHWWRRSRSHVTSEGACPSSSPVVMWPHEDDPRAARRRTLRCRGRRVSSSDRHSTGRDAGCRDPVRCASEVARPRSPLEQLADRMPGLQLLLAPQPRAPVAHASEPGRRRDEVREGLPARVSSGAVRGLPFTASCIDADSSACRTVWPRRLPRGQQKSASPGLLLAGVTGLEPALYPRDSRKERAVKALVLNAPSRCELVIVGAVEPSAAFLGVCRTPAVEPSLPWAPIGSWSQSQDNGFRLFLRLMAVGDLRPVCPPASIKAPSRALVQVSSGCPADSCAADAGRRWR